MVYLGIWDFAFDVTCGLRYNSGLFVVGRFALTWLVVCLFNFGAVFGMV